MAKAVKRRRGYPSKIARHPERPKIEHDLARGVPVRVVAKKYALHPSCCYRHLQSMPPGFRAEKFAELLKPGANLETLRVEESEGLLVGLHNSRVRLELLRDAAEERCDEEIATRIAGEIRKHWELTGKLLGELGTLVSNVTVNNIAILESPQFAALQTGLLQVARKHPEARQDIVLLLRGLDRPGNAPPMIEGERAFAA